MVLHPPSIFGIQFIQMSLDGIRDLKAGSLADRSSIIHARELARVDAPILEVGPEPAPATPIVAAPLDFATLVKRSILRRLDWF